MEKNQFSIIKGRDFSQYLESIIKIDSATLPEKYVTDFERLKERYNANTDSFIGITLKNQLIGYFNFFPINAGTLLKIIDGTIDNDITLGKEDIIPYSSEKPFDIYIITAAVLPEWQNKEVIMLLQDEFKKFIREKVSLNYLIKNIFASVVSSDGDRLLRRMSFLPHEKNSACYSTTIERFLAL